MSPPAGMWGQNGPCRRSCEALEGGRRSGGVTVGPPSGPSPASLPTVGPGRQRRRESSRFPREVLLSEASVATHREEPGAHREHYVSVGESFKGTWDPENSSQPAT